jgi:hypothetical protein
MNDETSRDRNNNLPSQPVKDNVTPFNCLMASLVSSGLAVAIYSDKPAVADNQFVLRITVAVRTLVIGVAALGTGVFGFVAIGLFLLGLQVTFKSLKSEN